MSNEYSSHVGERQERQDVAANADWQYSVVADQNAVKHQA